jgi:hypothetical protein
LNHSGQANTPETTNRSDCQKHHTSVNEYAGMPYDSKSMGCTSSAKLVVVVLDRVLVVMPVIVIEVCVVLGFLALGL